MKYELQDERLSRKFLSGVSSIPIMTPSWFINFIWKYVFFWITQPLFEIFIIFLLKTLDKMTELNFVT